MPNAQDQRELAANSYNEFHKIFWVFITLLGSILQTMYQPFETHYPKAVAFVVTIVIYFSSLLAELFLRTTSRDHIIVNKLSLFSGVLAVVLPILIIVPAIGWLALGIWVCVSGIVVYRFYDEIRDDFVEIVAEFRSVMNKLRNGNANESRDEPLRLPV
ncbi:hypothetical protein LOK49_LG10G02335 [Camellia lanceoleosa]|uniref:Uncharacterized protein n=1 Tax=Camellia lanceoleosa TaxID=1840588 RepID=A0ACC0G976_9ERIC|nr:hypothetical protein LOK49_LG10G02335 [Camellia lanceoleosa]